jgi:Leucine-rich repeat (LRR) protein
MVGRARGVLWAVSLALAACGGEAALDARPSASGGASGSSGGAGTAGAGACDGLGFENAALEAAVRKELGKPSGQLSAAELASARSIIVWSPASLAGAECLTGLQYLSVNGGAFADLSPISGLSELLSIYLAGGEMRSLAPLAGLPKLETLGISHARVNDLTPLAQVTSLRWLSLYAEVTDLTPLAGHPNLEKLELYDTPVSDVSPLSGMPRLKLLKLDQTNVFSLDIAEAPLLEELSIAYTGIADLSPVAAFTALRQLRAEGSFIDDISALADLSELWSVNLAGTRVHDLSPLLRPPRSGTPSCPPLNVANTPLDERSASQLIPELCSLGWAVFDGVHPLETCRPECVHL